MQLTLPQFSAIVPRAHTFVLGPLNAALQKADCNNTFRVAMFVAQWAHESGSFRYLEEQTDGLQYEFRKDLGNVHPGDGPRYKGRGWPQLTGHFNYERAGHDLGLDLLTHPELAAAYPTAADLGAWFWTTHGLNKFADEGDLEGATHRINGGLNGLAERGAFYTRALEVLKDQD